MRTRTRALLAGGAAIIVGFLPACSNQTTPVPADMEATIAVTVARVTRLGLTGTC